MVERCGLALFHGEIKRMINLAELRESDAPYIIAEIGCNHNGDLDLAKQMIRGAKECGCQAVKFQLWEQKNLFTKKYLQDLNDGIIRLENVSEWKTKELGLNNIFDQVRAFSIGEKEHGELFDFARELKIDYSSTAVTKEGVDFLIDQKVAFVKLASMDVNNPDLLEYLIAKDYPALISLGMASLDEIKRLVKMVPSKYRKNIVLLHCVSLYPPKDEMVNLKVIKALRGQFKMAIGFSDHSLGCAISLAAVALGARVIEKHFTLDKNLPGWDHKSSADPKEMAALCRESRRIVTALGDGRKELSPDEIQKRLKFRRSLVAARKLTSGEIIKKEDIAVKRPGTGIAPDELAKVVGRKVKTSIEEDELIEWKKLS